MSIANQSPTLDSPIELSVPVEDHKARNDACTRVQEDRSNGRNLQLDACIPNFLVQEQVTLGEGYLKRTFKLHDGYIELLKEPGLGIELDDKLLRGKTFDGEWETPRLYYEDGSVADW